MTTSTMQDKHKKFLTYTAVAAFWFVTWQLLSRSIGQEILLPSATAVAGTLLRLWGTADFWLSVCASLLRVLVGFCGAVTLGTALAMFTCRFQLLHTLFSPLLHIVRAAPVASFIILAYFWIETDLLPAFIAFLMVVPMVWANVSQGIRQTDGKLLEMAKVYRLSRGKILRHVWLPSVKPYFLAACTTGLGFAWKSGIAAEVICSPDRAIGTELRDAKAYLETPEVFAWTVTVVVLSVLLERVLLHLVQRSKKGGAA